MPDEQEQVIRELVSGWMARARSDLAVAKMTENEEIAPEILAFHAQQTVEKALKALLVQRQVEFPRTHNIGVLINLCHEGGYLTDDVPVESVALSRYAVTARYPGEMETISREEARLAANLASLIFEWAESQLLETG